MLLTEDEARKKWCPFVRALNSSMPAAYNRRNNDTAGSLCIASACMAWHWYDPDNPTQGRCGLAGK